jgi:hypothetical protein
MIVDEYIPEASLKQWWQNIRLIINRGLILDALVTYLICGITAFRRVNLFENFGFIFCASILFFLFYFVYGYFVNVLFYVVSLIDQAFHRSHKSILRESLFILSYGLALGMPTWLYIIVVSAVFRV